MTDQKRSLAALFTACSQDDALKARFMNDPRAVLTEHGIDVPDDREIRVVENTPEVLHLALPPASSPADSGDLSDEQLEAASGGGRTIGPDFDVALANQQMELQEQYLVG